MGMRNLGVNTTTAPAEPSPKLERIRRQISETEKELNAAREATRKANRSIEKEREDNQGRKYSMDVRIGNVDLFLLFVSPRPFKLTSTETSLLFVAEFFAVCFAAVYIPFVIQVFGKTSLFHKNLVRLTQALILVFYPSMLSRIVLFLFELDILQKGGINAAVDNNNSIRRVRMLFTGAGSNCTDRILAMEPHLLGSIELVTCDIS
ncbi:hypothetical protein GCK32_010127 [Trichostrongylus colubriformis]|uniref:Uncharacterized protein n=1 Tax=Trichostrongylus colubriformis TaxID=6319 RepID=A0AAN8GET6_TRICO